MARSTRWTRDRATRSRWLSTRGPTCSWRPRCSSCRRSSTQRRRSRRWRRSSRASGWRRRNRPRARRWSTGASAGCRTREPRRADLAALVVPWAPMDFEFNDDERLLAETARRIVARDVDPILTKHPQDQPLPKSVMLDLYRAIGDLGYPGARIPEDDGGSGLSHVMLGILNETLPPVLAFSLMGHESTTKRLHMGGTPEQKKRFLPDLLAGRKLAGTAASEPNVGSDPRGIETTARLDGDHYVLNGTKLWISNGPILDLTMV